MKKIFVTMMMVVMMMAMVGCGTKEDKVVADTNTTTEETTNKIVIDPVKESDEEVVNEVVVEEVSRDKLSDTDILATAVVSGKVEYNTFTADGPTNFSYKESNGFGACEIYVQFSCDEYPMFLEYEDKGPLTIEVGINKNFDIISIEIVE